MLNKCFWGARRASREQLLEEWAMLGQMLARCGPVGLTCAKSGQTCSPDRSHCAVRSTPTPTAARLHAAGSNLNLPAILPLACTGLGKRVIDGVIAVDGDGSRDMDARGLDEIQASCAPALVLTPPPVWMRMPAPCMQRGCGRAARLR